MKIRSSRNSRLESIPQEKYASRLELKNIDSTLLYFVILVWMEGDRCPANLF